MALTSTINLNWMSGGAYGDGKKSIIKLIIALICVYFIWKLLVRYEFFNLLSYTNFESKMGLGGRVTNSGNYQNRLTLFWSSGCGHCSAMKPDWNAAAKKLRGVNGLEVVDVQCDSKDGRDFCRKYESTGLVQGYPTIVLEQGVMKKVYNGPRTSDAIQDWVLKQ